MKHKEHLKLITQTPEYAQLSNFQIKLETTTDMIDRLLLVPRQAPWKAIGIEGDDDDSGTDTNTNTNDEL